MLLEFKRHKREALRFHRPPDLVTPLTGPAPAVAPPHTCHISDSLFQIGPESNLLERGPAQCQRLLLPGPLLLPHEMDAIKKSPPHGWKSATLDTTIPTGASFTDGIYMPFHSVVSHCVLSRP